MPRSPGLFDGTYSGVLCTSAELIDAGVRAGADGRLGAGSVAILRARGSRDQSHADPTGTGGERGAMLTTLARHTHGRSRLTCLTNKTSRPTSPCDAACCATPAPGAP